MKTWLNSEGLAKVTRKSLVTAQRIIKAHASAYPLCVRKMIPVGKKSRPFYEILWDTAANQPATTADQPTEAAPLLNSAMARAADNSAITGDTYALDKNQKACNQEETKDGYSAFESANARARDSAKPAVAGIYAGDNQAFGVNRVSGASVQNITTGETHGEKTKGISTGNQRAVSLRDNAIAGDKTQSHEKQQST